MAKKESTLLNMVLALGIVTLVASTSLGYIYELTKEPIEAARLAKRIRAIGAVVPDYDNNPVSEMYRLPAPGNSDSLDVYPVSKNGEPSGYALRSVSAGGYGGNIWLMVGFLPDGTIYDISVLEHKETPGLGTKLAGDPFRDQFKGKNPSDFDLRVTKDGGDVDALTGATISSRAFGEAAQLAYDTFMKAKGHDQ